ncbi:MAG: hypothetical protein QNJ61_11465 [Desulfobacterales bacterium]|nr:hypothetical protein [Desulfobacterales bacterium]
MVIKDQKVAIRDLLDALIDFDEKWLHDFFDERGQMDVGVYLYRQLFGDTSAEEISRNCDAMDLRIVTQDEDMARLPWLLLADRGVFLSTAGWSISLADQIAQQSFELPPSPKILVIAPQPAGWEATEGQEHIAELKALLENADQSYLDDSRFKNVSTWPALLTHLKSFQPDILYYYGHGKGDRHTTRLVFEDDVGRPDEKPLADIQAALQSTPGQPPLLAYINCCQGDAGGLLGAGRQLSALVPAVVTNRTAAFISAARPQGIAFWEAVLLRGEQPHKAVSTMRGRLGDLGLSTADTRWLAPVLHGNYSEWRANPPTPPSRLDRDPHWQLKLDRVSQFSKVYYQTSQMFRERKPRALAYLWYGTADQGMEIFHHRLGVELAESLTDVIIYEVRPAWPEDLFSPEQSFSDMLCQAFEVASLDHLPGRIRTYGGQVTGKRILVYIRHQPALALEYHRFNHQHIQTYLKWWGKKFVPQLPETAHALLGLSFEVGRPAKFHKWLTEKQRLHELVLQNSVFELLDELEKVTKRDLQAFIQTHNIKLPDDIKDQVLEETLSKTDGSYVKLLDELKQLESRAWRKQMESRLQDTEPYEDEEDSEDFY